ncbi:Pleckstrin homology domain-containing family G member 7 [Bagarius yarrelli]|uniref:Pleckstrin homology domain-containing family G member 7 n=1 Tax=Bagarius yarrelli TaxID=175774 RepID=A0A556TQX8_BAGYA|nr:Pleckstrin homology domain-containing family G member 7 [Bagarius yarrelli]
MTDLNYDLKENGKHERKTLDWTYIEWHDEDMAETSDVYTQTSEKSVAEKETQTSNPILMRIQLSRTSSRLRCGSLGDVDTMPTPLFQFDRQAPARISTSPTLRRMRSTRLPYRDAGKISSPQEEPGVKESLSPRSPVSPANHQKSPLAIIENQSDEDSHWNGHANDTMTPGNVRSYRSKTISSSGPHLKQEFLSMNVDTDTDDDNTREERRRSSVVVTLPGLDVSPGDLFVSNDAVDILNRSTFSESKKSKWPFSKRTMNKGRTRTAADIEKCLTAIQIQDWRNTHFQQYKDLTLEEFLSSHPELSPEEEPKAHKRQEALWELFTSECVYFLDQLMVLKEVFLTTLSDLQLRECLQDIELWALFANLNELCLVSFGFLTSLLHTIKELWAAPESPETNSTETLLAILKKAFGESICHCLQKYCLNYSKALVYLDTLKVREDFSTYVKNLKHLLKAVALENLVSQRSLRYEGKLTLAASGLPCSFIIMHQNRYQQCIGVFILQAPTEAVKKAWLTEIEEASMALLTRDSQQQRLKSSSVYVESSQI